MSIADLRKHQVPAPAETPQRSAFDTLSMSINDVIHVADTTERAQVVADLITDGHDFAARPVYFDRLDTGTIERTADGTTFPRVYGPMTRLAWAPSLWDSSMGVTQEVTPKGWRMTLEGRLTRTGPGFTLTSGAYIGIGTIALPTSMKPNVGAPDIFAHGIRPGSPVVMVLVDGSTGAVSLRSTGADIIWSTGNILQVQGAVWYRDL